MNRCGWAWLVAPLLLVACAPQPGALPGAGTSGPASPSAVASALPTARPLEVTYPPPCRDFVPGAAGADAAPLPGVDPFDQGPVLDMAERVEALAARLPGFTSLAVDSGHQQVEVYWVGEPPAQLQALDDADPVVDLVVGTSLFTEVQLDAAADRVSGALMGSRRTTGFQVITVGACFDGSGIEADVVGPDSETPDTIPAAWVARIQRVAGDIPVSVVPGTPIMPAAGA